MKRKMVDGFYRLEGLNGMEIYDLFKYIQEIIDALVLDQNANKNSFVWVEQWRYDDVEMGLKYSRPETNKELNKRKKSQQKKNATIKRNKEKRRQQYEKLKKEFGNE